MIDTLEDRSSSQENLEKTVRFFEFNVFNRFLLNFDFIQGTGYSPVDGSHTSLRNKLKMMPADGGSIVCQKVTEEDHRLLSSPESNK